MEFGRGVWWSHKWTQYVHSCLSHTCPIMEDSRDGLVWLLDIHTACFCLSSRCSFVSSYYRCLLPLLHSLSPVSFSLVCAARESTFLASWAFSLFSLSLLRVLSLSLSLSSSVSLHSSVGLAHTDSITHTSPASQPQTLTHQLDRGSRPL